MFDWLFQPLVDLSGAPPDYVKLIFLLIIASPLAYPLPSLGPQGKHVACILTSAFFLLGVLQLHVGFVQLLGTSLLTYALATFKVGGKRMPWIVFFVEMTHLTVNHLIRAYGNIPLTTIEVTAMQMVLTMNLTTFAWDVYDGQIRTEEQCDAQQKTTRIVQMPGLVEFLGYCFYFPGVLIGPSTRFVDYRAWAHGTLYTSVKGKEKEQGVATPQQPPPGRVQAAMRELAIGLFFLGVYTAFAPGWDFTALVLPAELGGLAADRGFWFKVWFAVIASFMARTKYYGIWTLTNASCILSGLSYNGLAPISVSATSDLVSRTRWDRCQNVDITGVEFAQNWKELLDHWNMNTNVWLRNNIYKRVTRPGKKPGFKSTMTTFLTSAFWHGVAPGYYMAFLYGGFCQSVARSLRKSLRPRFFPASTSTSITAAAGQSTQQTPVGTKLFQWGYIVLSIVTVHLSLAFAAMAFILLDVKATWRGWAALNFYGLWSIGGLTLAFRLGLGRYLSGSRSLGNGEAQTKAKRLPQGSPGDPVGTTGKVERQEEEQQERIEEKTFQQEVEKEPGVQLFDVDVAERDLREKLKEM